jgi:hypothetical protein
MRGLPYQVVVDNIVLGDQTRTAGTVNDRRQAADHLRRIGPCGKVQVNHSCEPNVGMGGNVLLVSMRDIAAGEELTIDYALFRGDPYLAMECRCRTAACRAVVKGTGWMRTDLQVRYRGWFSRWLQQKIAQTQSNPGP